MLCRWAWESSFPNIISQKSCENPIFLRLFSGKSILANFHVYFQYIQICEGALALWRHSDAIWRSMVLILVSMDRGGPYLYGTLVANIGVSSVPYKKFQGGGCNKPPPFGGRVTENTAGGRGLRVYSRQFLQCISHKSIESNFNSPLFRTQKLANITAAQSLTYFLRDSRQRLLLSEFRLFQLQRVTSYRINLPGNH